MTLNFKKKNEALQIQKELTKKEQENEEKIKKQKNDAVTIIKNTIKNSDTNTLGVLYNLIVETLEERDALEPDIINEKNFKEQLPRFKNDELIRYKILIGEEELRRK